MPHGPKCGKMTWRASIQNAKRKDDASKQKRQGPMRRASAHLHHIQEAGELLWPGDVVNPVGGRDDLKHRNANLPSPARDITVQGVGGQPKNTTATTLPALSSGKSSKPRTFIIPLGIMDRSMNKTTKKPRRSSGSAMAATMDLPPPWVGHGAHTPYCSKYLRGPSQGTPHAPSEDTH